MLRSAGSRSTQRAGVRPWGVAIGPAGLRAFGRRTCGRLADRRRKSLRGVAIRSPVAKAASCYAPLPSSSQIRSGTVGVARCGFGCVLLMMIAPSGGLREVPRLWFSRSSSARSMSPLALGGYNTPPAIMCTGRCFREMPPGWLALRDIMGNRPLGDIEGNHPLGEMSNDRKAGKRCLTARFIDPLSDAPHSCPSAADSRFS